MKGTLRTTNPLCAEDWENESALFRNVFTHGKPLLRKPPMPLLFVQTAQKLKLKVLQLDSRAG